MNCNIIKKGHAFMKEYVEYHQDSGLSDSTIVQYYNELIEMSILMMDQLPGLQYALQKENPRLNHLMAIWTDRILDWSLNEDDADADAENDNVEDAPECTF